VTDWGQVSQSFFDGGAWGIGFAIPFFVGITYAILRILSHPTIRQLARAAAKMGESGWAGVAKEVIGFFRQPPQG
jgi:hypothetical protein